MFNRMIVAAAMLVLWGAATAHGQEDLSSPTDRPQRRVDLKIYLENDSPGFKPNDSTDRQYTNGDGLSISFQPKPAWALGLTAGQLMFTPDNIHARNLQNDDRPYAGYLYGGLFLQHQSASADVPSLDHLQLDLGMVGPSSLAEDAQKTTHDLTDADEPRGWDNQLRDEFTAQLTLRKSWRFDLVKPWPPEGVLFELTPDAPPPTNFGVQVIPEVGLAAGNVFRHLEGQAVLRAGWNLPDDFGPGRLTHLGSFAGQVQRSGRLPGAGAGGAWSFYGFGRVGGKLVEHNLLIEGNTWRDSHHVDVEPWVGELELGLVLAYHWKSWSAEVGYSQTFLTQEFGGQDGNHAYGAWTAALTGWF
jgi:hypothetical protein